MQIKLYFVMELINKGVKQLEIVKICAKNKGIFFIFEHYGVEKAENVTCVDN